MAVGGLRRGDIVSVDAGEPDIIGRIRAFNYANDILLADIEPLVIGGNYVPPDHPARMREPSVPWRIPIALLKRPPMLYQLALTAED